ncbi:uncharacterized protein LOC135494349 [Lineus longissimus]|uniref:uncharacterized protein LOC135494349 n=1 Tax=Lineus longissimus TaxID=88925 RepID=UPI00315CA33C
MDGTGVERKCTKNFPKPFSLHTIVTEDNYPTYRRRSPQQGGHTHEMTVCRNDFLCDNSFIVPYNPLLSLRYSAHINIEVVHSVQAVKYLYKYITKGQDRIIFSLTADGTQVAVLDEVENYLNARYISARLTWNGSKKQWQRRKRGTKLTNTQHFQTDNVGRIPTISLSPHQSELYHLRTLLHHKAGAQTYEEMRTVNAVECGTFQEACLQLGLITEDKEIHRAMTEACTIRFGDQLRNFFSTLLMYCRPADPNQFWTTWKEELCRDYMYRDKATTLSNYNENEALQHIQNILQRDNLDLATDSHLPIPDATIINTTSTRRIIAEETFDTTLLQESAPQLINTLNPEQRQVFELIMSAVNDNARKIFCLNASGGTGKTYLINVLLTTIRAEGNVALETALSGIAATLLNNGRTLHSRCKIPINLTEHSTCNISNKDATADLLRLAKILIIDEVSMGHIFECLDRSLQDIRDSEHLFGGLIVLFAGDWRQILPVVPHGSRPQIVEATLKKSYLWSSIQTLQLTCNMRTNTQDTTNFPQYLTNIGNGTKTPYPDIGPHTIKVPEHFTQNITSLTDLCNFVFTKLPQNFTQAEWLSSREIIAPTNKAVQEINTFVINRFPGTSVEYKSCDTILENEHQYPLEFINRLNPAGLPPHSLILKMNCCIMLLRNFDPLNGHCNGTRYTITGLHQHIIEAVIATGPHAGKRLFIPRIPMAPSNNTFPFQMQRRSFQFAWHSP